jgi:FkbM family methyltransferase
MSKLIRYLIDRFFIKNPALRLWVTRRLEGDAEREVSLLGVQLRLHPVREHGYLRASRLAVRSSLFGDEMPVLITLSSLLPFVDAFVDVGANIGLYSAGLGKLRVLFPHLEIHAFEADPDTYQRLNHNVKTAGATAHHQAVSHQAGQLTFVRGAVSHVTTTVENKNHYSLNETFEVPSTRLDAVEVSGQQILLKIDVEGHEWQALQGAEKWFLEKRCAVVYLDGCECRQDICAFLQKHGFKLLDGRSLQAATEETFALLAVREDWLAGVQKSLVKL